MRRLRTLVHAVAALSIVAVASSVPRLAAQDLTPPSAKIIARVDTLHGEIRTDNYFWLRNKSNPEVISYLEKENASTAAKMKHTEALQQRLYDEMLGRIKENDLSVPYREVRLPGQERTCQRPGFVYQAGIEPLNRRGSPSPML